MRKLPVFQSFREVYSGVFAHFLELLRVAWLPLTIWLLVSALWNWWFLRSFPIDQMTVASEMGGLSAEQMRAAQAANAAAMLKIMPQLYGLLFFQFIVMSIAAVGFHRFVLLGERVHGWGRTGFSFGRNEILYVWSMIKIGFVGSLCVLVIAAVVGAAAAVAGLVGGGMANGTDASRLAPALLGTIAIGYSAIMVAMLLVMSRLSLVLPHVALGNPSQLRLIWNMTKGNSWRLVGYFMLVMLCAALVSMVALVPVDLLLGIPLISTPDSLRDFIANPWKLAVRFVVGVPITLAWVMLSITMLSVAYREIVGLPADGGTVGEPDQP